jgi:peptide/nickel transport system permease protein
MFYLKKTFYYISLLFGIILFSFILFHAIPTDPVRTILGPNADEKQVETLRNELGLNKPLSVQLINYISKTIRLDFGKSYTDNRSVLNEVSGKFKVSLILVTISLFFLFLYILIFILCSLKLSWPFDILNFLFVSTPTFFSGIIIAILAFSFYPYTVFSGYLNTVDDFLYMIPPAIVLAIYPMAILAKILKQEIQKINNSDFITHARAQGLSEIKIRFRYVLRNVSIPFLAAFSNQLPMLFTSAFIVEVLFSLPGMGSLLIKSILQKDFPTLEGVVILNGMLFIVTNLIFEFIYPIIDPRIHKTNA